jgi:single-strand DNA-binding protein
MSKMIGLARLGRDAEIRTTSQGESVATLALAFSYGRKGSDGRRPTQWVDGALWGKRAEALAPYLLKGGLVSVLLEDVHIETYQGKNGEASKLVGRVVDVELAGGGERTAAPAPAPAPRAAQRAAPAAGSGFDDLGDDEIPF